MVAVYIQIHLYIFCWHQKQLHLSSYSLRFAPQTTTTVNCNITTKSWSTQYSVFAQRVSNQQIIIIIGNNLKHLIRCRGLYLRTEYPTKMFSMSKKVDRGDIFDFYNCRISNMAQNCCFREEKRIKVNRRTHTQKNKKTKRMVKLLVDEAIAERRSQTKLMASHFNCKKVTVSLIPMRQCSRSNKSEPVRINQITVYHCVNTKWKRERERKIVRIRLYAIAKEK